MPEPGGEASKRRPRVDENGLAFRGSQLQTQLYVNDRRDELNAAILAKLPELAARQPILRWVSPLREDGYREYWDAGFLRALGLDELADRLSEWWPRGGPHWDALARLDFPDGRAGVLVVEGKGYPDEMYDEAGSGAKSEKSVAQIARALDETRAWLGADPRKASAWKAPLYQTANRLAALYWLMQQLDGRAWLVHLCFVNDPTHVSTTAEQWEGALRKATEQLGITQPIPNYAHVLRPGVPRPEPASPAGPSG